MHCVVKRQRAAGARSERAKKDRMRLATSRVLGAALASCLIVPLSGCVTYSEVRDTRLTAEAAAMPTMDLCIEYLSSPGGTDSQRARAKILAQRGETCQAYLGAAQVRANANAAEAQRRAIGFQKSMELLLQTPQPAPRNTVTCHTVGATTNCR